MSAVDSEAFFDGRMNAMGITNATAIAVRARGWTSLAAYAYGCGFIPGQMSSVTPRVLRWRMNAMGVTAGTAAKVQAKG